MEDSFRSKGSYSRSQYSESTSSDLMKQLSSDVTISSNSSKKSNKKHHAPKLDSKSFYPEEYDEPRDINNQQANYAQNQQDNFYSNNNGNGYRQHPPRFQQNQNYNSHYNKNPNKNYHHQQRNQQNWNQGYGGNYNNNNNNNKNYQNRKFSKGPFPKHQNYTESSETSESLSNRILPDLSFEEFNNQTQAIAQKFDVSVGLIGFNDEEKDEDDPSLGHLLESFTTENEKEPGSEGGQKRKSKQKFTLQGLGVELHNIYENRLIVMKMKIELPCSECTFLSYQILSKKDVKDPWIFKAKRCRFCLESSKNILQVRYDEPSRWENDFSNGQLTLGRFDTLGVSSERITTNNIREINFQFQCAGCKEKYPITCIQYKDSEDFLIDENMSCRSWNCYKLMMIRVKKIQLNKTKTQEQLKAIPEAADSNENPGEESIVH